MLLIHNKQTGTWSIRILQHLLYARIFMVPPGWRVELEEVTLEHQAWGCPAQHIHHSCYRCSSSLAALFCVVWFDTLLRKLHRPFWGCQNPNFTLGAENSLGFQGLFEVTVTVTCGCSDRGVLSMAVSKWFRWLISEFLKWLFLCIFCLEIKLSRMTALDLLSAQHEGGKLTQTWVEESRAEVYIKRKDKFWDGLISDTAGYEQLGKENEGAQERPS